MGYLVERRCKNWWFEKQTNKQTLFQEEGKMDSLKITAHWYDTSRILDGQQHVSV